MEQMQPMSEIRVVFLGDGEAGKSHIMARLLNDGGDPRGYQLETTPGIAIDKKDYDLRDRKLRVHYWDFGGQEIQLSMYRLFLTKQTVYVVVVNARNNDLDGRARYWLHELEWFAPGAPVLLVLNKIDQNPSAYVNATALRSKYKQLTQIIRLSARDFSQQEYDENFTRILLEEIRNTDCMNMPWPASWMAVRQTLERLERPYITSDDYWNICEEWGVGADAPDLLQQLHDLGICFHIDDDPRLQNYVVLQPECITRALYVILSGRENIAWNGLVSRASIYDLLSRAGSSVGSGPSKIWNTAADVEYLLGVTRRALLTFRIDAEREFIPALCRQEASVDIQYYQRDAETLECHMRFAHLPESLLYRLMVQRHEELDIDDSWRTGARFHQRGTGLSAVVAIEENELLIFVPRGDGRYQPHTYLAELKEDVERLAGGMNLGKPMCQLIYKQDGLWGAFDYDELLSSLEHGEKRVYSRNHRRMLSILDILNQTAPEASNDNVLVEHITTACRKLQSFPLPGGEAGISQALQFYLQGDGIGAVSGRQRANIPGDLDLFLTDIEHNPLTAIETVRISGGAGSMRAWDEHLTRLLYEGSAQGLSALFLLGFVECEADQFADLWQRYHEHLRRYSPDRVELLRGSFEEIDAGEAQFLKIVRCRYSVRGSDVTVYSYFVRVTTKPQAEKPKEDILLPINNGPSSGTVVAQLEDLSTDPEPIPAPELPEELQNDAKKPKQESLLQKVLQRLLEKPEKPAPVKPDPVLKECRVVFLGDSEAGKTLIMSRVEKPEMDPATFHGNTTIGINIFSRVEDVGKERVRVNYWDFGGQEILHSMHRMFLSDGTLYVIVLNTRNDNQDAQADFWLRYVEAYAPRAPVMLVMNKIDQNKRASLNLPVLRRRFSRELNDSNVLKISAVDKSPSAFKDGFKKKLLDYIAQKPECIHSFEPLEAEIRDAVERKQEKVFSPHDFMALCGEMGLTDEDKQYDLMDRFNFAGIMVYFGDENPMCLNPKWITSLIYRVLDQGGGISSNGILSNAQLGTICAKNPDGWRGADDVNFLTQIMRDYELAFVCEKKGTSTRHLIPMLCQREEPETIEALIREDDPVEMRMVFEYLPGGVLYKLMAKYQDRLDKKNIWLTGAKFDQENGGYVIVRQENSTMAIYVHDVSKTGAMKRLIGLMKEIKQYAREQKFNATLFEVKVGYRIAGVKEYFDYHQLVNAKRGRVRFVTSTREESETGGEEPPKIPVLDILDQDESKDKREVDELLDQLLRGCMDVQRDKIFWPANENAKNRQLGRALRDPFISRDQPQAGVSASGESEGELDLEILNERGITFAILEALITTSTKNANWKEHLDRLVENYNTSGIQYLILTSYIRGPKKDFYKKFQESMADWDKLKPKGFEDCLVKVEEVRPRDCPELIRITRAVYTRNQVEVSLFHFMVHIGADKDEAAPNAANK